MSDALIGVLVGGAIASITPVLQMIYNHRRWKQETRLTCLKEMRLRLEAKNTQTIEELSKALFAESWGPELTSYMMALVPEKAMSRLSKYLKDKDKSIEAKRSTLHDMAFELRLAEADIDSQIEEILR